MKKICGKTKENLEMFLACLLETTCIGLVVTSQDTVIISGGDRIVNDELLLKNLQ